MKNREVSPEKIKQIKAEYLEKIRKARRQNTFISLLFTIVVVALGTLSIC